MSKALIFNKKLMKTKFIVLITALIGFMSHAQSIEKFSIDSGGASASAGGLEVLYTIGEVNVQESDAGTVSVSEGFINSQSKILMELLVLLQGPSLNPTIAGLMNDDLRANNYLPTTSPYADGVTVDASIFATTGLDAIVDWVWVELRQANDNTKIVNAKSALLQREGEIVGLDGVSVLEMNASPTNYYVVIKHRNHLGAMSANPIALSEDETVVDFIGSSFLTFGSNARVQLTSGDMALWAGNVNGDTSIQYVGSAPENADLLAAVLNNPANFLGLPSFPISNVYSDFDVDMNGSVLYTGGSVPDITPILQNVLSYPGNFLGLTSWPIFERLPENSATSRVANSRSKQY